MTPRSPVPLRLREMVPGSPVSMNFPPSDNSGKPMDISVTDMLGRQVFASVIDINTPSGKTQTDLSSLKQGVYFINIKSGDNSYSSKLVIE